MEQIKQYIISSTRLRKMKDELRNKKGSDLYFKKTYIFGDADLLSSETKTPNKPVAPALPGTLTKLKLRGYADLEYKNAKILFEAYQNLTPEDASDERFWAYLTHTTFWDYMKKRTNLGSVSEEKKGDYILTHWFLDPLSPKTIARNDIARLWWSAYLTHDEKLKDPYMLTRQLFSMQDYSRTLIEGVQGRNRNVLHGVLSFVIDNPELFKQRKEAKVRFVMRKINQIGGYRLLSSVSKKEVKNTLKKLEKEITSVK
ncbi:hypothetical protein IIA95_03040 [Patescibacteria group bacterium]|nr:hypothetical protein [Patescibacteria group bacterium]